MANSQREARVKVVMVFLCWPLAHSLFLNTSSLALACACMWFTLKLAYSVEAVVSVLKITFQELFKATSACANLKINQSNFKHLKALAIGNSH